MERSQRSSLQPQGTNSQPPYNPEDDFRATLLESSSGSLGPSSQIRAPRSSGNQYLCVIGKHLKPASDFTNEHVMEKHGVNTQTNDNDRFCIDCGIKDGKYKPGKILRVIGKEAMVLCLACEKLKTTYSLTDKRCKPCEHIGYDRGHL